MKHSLALSGAFAVLLGSAVAASAADADAKRGAEFFSQQKCVYCHSAGDVQTTGKGNAPNLTRTLDRDYTPSGISARMWNHAPAMWTSMAKAGIAPPAVDESGAADLFAFLYSARYFEKPGDAGRGRAAFDSKHCSACHAVGKSGATGGPAVATWRSISDPVALVDHMWNHGAQMRGEFARRKWKVPQLSAQELTDILVYVRNTPDSKKASTDFLLPPQSSGDTLFKDKGCDDCHHGTNALERALQNRTLTDVAASMWNHAPKMKNPAPQLSYEEMRQILGDLWSRQFFNPHGDADKGRRVFEAKRCVTCHKDSAPKVTTLPSMVAALWKHGPAMLSTMETKGIDWPILTAPEMASLVAYLGK